MATTAVAERLGCAEARIAFTRIFGWVPLLLVDANAAVEAALLYGKGGPWNSIRQVSRHITLRVRPEMAYAAVALRNADAAECLLEFCHQHVSSRMLVVHFRMCDFDPKIIRVILRHKRAAAQDLLHAAAEHGAVEAVKVLMTVADVTDLGCAALRYAAAAGHADVVSLLTDTCPAAWNSWALRRAAANGHVAVVDLLLPRSDPWALDFEAMRLAAANGFARIVERLIHVAKPSSSAVKWAVRAASGQGFSDVVNILLCLTNQQCDVMRRR